MISDNVTHEDKELLYRLSKLSCAMITQAVKDFMRVEDTETAIVTHEDAKKMKTKNAAITKYKESAEKWLIGEEEGVFSLKTCCLLINTKLIFSGFIGDASEGISVKLFAKLVHAYNNDEDPAIVTEQLDKLTKITYLSERDQQSNEEVTIYNINMPSDFVDYNEIYYRGASQHEEYPYEEQLEAAVA